MEWIGYALLIGLPLAFVGCVLVFGKVMSKAIRRMGTK